MGKVLLESCARAKNPEALASGQGPSRVLRQDKELQVGKVVLEFCARAQRILLELCSQSIGVAPMGLGCPEVLVVHLRHGRLGFWPRGMGQEAVTTVVLRPRQPI